MFLSLLRRILNKHNSTLPRRKRQESYLDSLRKQGVIIGSNTAIYNCIIDTNFPFLIEIGSNCILTHTTILAHDASPLIFNRQVIVGRVRISDGCFIGANSIIMPGVTIGAGSIVGAMTVVTQDIPPNSIVAGNPGRVISKTNDRIKNGKNRLSNKLWIEVKSESLVISESEEQEMINSVRNMINQGKL